MLIISIIAFIITCIALLCFFQREHKRAMFSIFSKNIKNASKAFYDYVDELFIEKGRDFFDNVLIAGGVERYVSDFDQYFKKMCQEKFVTFKSFSDYDEAYDKAYKEEREKAKNECSFYKELSTEGIKTHFLLYIINYFVHLISFELNSEVYDSIYESKLFQITITF